MEQRIDYNIVNTPEQTSGELAQLAIELLQIKEGETVADLCCCKGDFLSEVVTEFNNTNLYGSDISIDYCNKAKHKLERMGANHKIECKNMFDVNVQKKFDKIFVHPPFGMTHKADDQMMQFFNEQFPEARSVSNPNVELMCIKLASLLLTKAGKAVVLAPVSATYKPSDKMIRESIVEDGSLKSVLGLPCGIFGHTAVQGVAYVVEGKNSGIEFIDDKVSRVVSNKEIKNHRFELNPKTYLRKPIILDQPTHLGEVCSEILRSNLAKNKGNNACHIGIGVVYSVKIGDMQDGLVSLQRASEEELTHIVNGVKLKKRDILLSRVTSPVNAAIYEHESNIEAYAHNNIYVLRADETKINPYYLCAFFNSNLGKEVLSRKGLGSHMPVISIKVLRVIQIPLLSLEVQNKIGEEYRRQCKRIKLLKKKLEDERNKVRKFNAKDIESNNQKRESTGATK